MIFAPFRSNYLPACPGWKRAISTLPAAAEPHFRLVSFGSNHNHRKFPARQFVKINQGIELCKQGFCVSVLSRPSIIDRVTTRLFSLRLFIHNYRRWRSLVKISMGHRKHEEGVREGVFFSHTPPPLLLFPVYLFFTF